MTETMSLLWNALRKRSLDKGKRGDGQSDCFVCQCGFRLRKILIQCWRATNQEEFFHQSISTLQISTFQRRTWTLTSGLCWKHFLYNLTLVDNRLPYWGFSVQSKYVYRQFVKFTIRNDVRESILTRLYSEDSICSVLYSLT